MTATKTQRPGTASILVPGLLFLGLVGLSVLPISCGPESDGASEEETTKATDASADRTILLNIGIEDETEDRPLSDVFLVETPDGARWTPEAPEGGSTTEVFEKYPVGEARTLRLYPEGEDGPFLEVPITMKPGMSSALASSRTDIFVYDDSIVVSGPAVPDEEVVLDRPTRGSE